MHSSSSDCDFIDMPTLLSPEELSRSVPPHQARQPSSPHFSRLQLADEDPRRMSRGGSPAPHGYRPGTPHSYPAYPDIARQSTPSNHPRNASDPSGYPAYAQSVPPHPSVHGYPHGYPPQYAQTNHPRQPIPTGSYPYAGSPAMGQPGMGMGMVGPPGPQHQPYPGTEPAATDRSSSSRYECSYCGKGFTRPSSLKVRRLLAIAPARARARTHARKGHRLRPSLTHGFLSVRADTPQHSHGREA